MTRKEELKERAIDLASGPVSYGEVLGELLRVERECWERMWSGLKVDNTTLRWALKELGPTGTNAEAYVKAAVEHVIWCRDQRKEVSE